MKKLIKSLPALALLASTSMFATSAHAQFFVQLSPVTDASHDRLRQFRQGAGRDLESRRAGAVHARHHPRHHPAGPWDQVWWLYLQQRRPCTRS